MIWDFTFGGLLVFFLVWRNILALCYKGWYGIRRTEMIEIGTVFDVNSLYLIFSCNVVDS